MNISSNMSTMSTSIAAVKSQNSSEPTTGVRIDIQPGDGNVDTGDRSNNTIQVSVVTPNHEASAEITRQQAVDRVEQRLQQKALGQLGNNQSDLNSLKIAVLKNSGINAEDFNQIATLRNQQRLAQTYLNVTPGNNAQPGQSTGSVNQYNQAIDAYVKQTLFFSTIDKATSTISTKA